MKKIFIILSIIITSLTSCEDVIEVELSEAQERLVVEASMLKFKGDDGLNQQIRLTKTRGFFEEEVTTVEDAVVTVTKDDGEIFVFEHDTSGIYRTNNFNSELLENYSLRIEVGNEVYSAQESFIPVSEIDSIAQRSDAGFSGEEIELRAFFKDPAGEDNSYLFTFFVNFIDFPEIDIFQDEFFDGNTVFALYTEEDLEPEDEVLIQNFGISSQFYEYMFVLLNQVGAGGGPFQNQPATVRGNIINETNPDNFAFGYFNLSETDLINYTVQEEDE